MRYTRLTLVLLMVTLAPLFSLTNANGSDTGTWSAASPMGYVRFSHQSVLLPDGRVLVVGGHYSHFNFGGPAEIYDPKTNSWTDAGWPQPWGEDHTIAVLRNGKVLVVGGWPPELYDPATNSWTKAGTMIAIRRWATATLMNNGKVLVAGGHIGTITSSAEVYDPDSNSWSPAASMNSARWSAAATLLPNGKVLVTGGGGGEVAECYDPATNTWSAAGLMSWDRSFHTLTVLADGKVLAAGGYHAGTGEIYDPATNAWSNKSMMPSPLYEHTATLLRDGKVLVTGGHTDNNLDKNVPPSPDAFLYDPVTNSWSRDSSMSIGRFKHSAVLMQDGNVLVTGGRIDDQYWIEDATWVDTAEIRSQRTFTISGIIRQGNSSGKGVKKATVSISNKTTTTDSTGAFSISGIPAGRYTMTISKGGYLTKTVTGFTVDSDMSEVEAVILRKGYGLFWREVLHLFHRLHVLRDRP